MRLMMNTQSKASVFFLCYKAHFYFAGYPRASFSPAHCFDSFCCFPLIWPVQSPISKLAKAALTWGEVLDLTLCKTGNKLDFDRFNCFARLHHKKGNAGQERNVIGVVCSPWIHHSLVVSPINIHVVWCVSPELNTERSLWPSSGPPVLC